MRHTTIRSFSFCASSGHRGCHCGFLVASIKFAPKSLHKLKVLEVCSLASYLKHGQRSHGHLLEGVRQLRVTFRSSKSCYLTKWMQLSLARLANVQHCVLLCNFSERTHFAIFPTSACTCLLTSASVPLLVVQRHSSQVCACPKSLLGAVAKCSLESPSISHRINWRNGFQTGGFHHSVTMQDWYCSLWSPSRQFRLPLLSPQLFRTQVSFPQQALPVPFHPLCVCTK